MLSNGLSEQFKGKSAYINCWNCRTEHKILEEILHQLGFVVHGRESTNKLSTNKLVRKLEKSVRKKVVVCLDEADQIREPEILYTLARNGLGIVLISKQGRCNGSVIHK